ncbi:FAD-binding protein [Amycolatopsis acidicola]|uniref:FAD-binding protein n=1 Tax=Amycolatopsis acidicola TaxID=2596893 RepID=A0A5N0UL41_9PSEU|nr:FAD-binding protein [Amycolatopsis acidicola]KAA9150414.1 FAD-binding protein [Amycolatopsis acidicola]
MTTQESTVLRPTDLREAHQALAETGGPVVIRGAGTAEGWGDPPGPAETTVDTSRLSGVLHYNPGDMTVAVLAGTPLKTLQDELRDNGQRVSFDAARVRRGATVGGLVATADSGPLALTYGSLRDLVIGATLVLADGTVARTGGHVIKNVAGYDLAKLVHGSYGSLALLAEVVLRLHPVPEGSATVRVAGTLAESAGRTAELMRASLEPVAVEWADGLLIRLEGSEDGVAARARKVIELIGGSLSDDDVWEQHATFADPDDGVVMRIGCRPSRLPGVLAGIPCHTVTAGLATGIATVSLAPESVEEAHAAVTGAGGTSVLRRHPPGLRAWGQRPSAAGVLLALKQELDPGARLAPGVFADWEERR